LLTEISQISKHSKSRAKNARVIYVGFIYLSARYARTSGNNKYKKIVPRFLLLKIKNMGDCKIDIGKLIIEKLEAKDRTIAWLARKIGRNGSNLHKTLKNSKYIHANLLFDISIVLENDFFA